MNRMFRTLPPLALGLALAACNPGGGAPDAEGAAKAAQILAAMPAPYNTADLAAGRQAFQLCSACHTAIEGGANMTGPNLYGVFGRKAASVADYKYSPVLKAAGWVWTPAQLDKWLASPQTTLPGTKMTFIGLKDAKTRTDLIAYLHVVSSGGPS
jgi:cytochrome c